ncbi:T9SS type A sorting domain-containing protein [Pinibacter aurantiacus]|uniref:T9SS type A sorting domain-containing protein n=1 Tax=Pinibacter aurantiacus TaxID=2851599 RepID=A0A9E2SAV2_9BACT|nr:T9SS type A sorting domain-containing protein [Pinibacter aurantiacus]MBV4357065.1 T9SS type A sorting domain-containing protein [Pinibacter aurantiacus]
MKPALLTLLLVVSFGIARSQLVPHYIPQAPGDTMALGFYSYTPPDYNNNPANKFPVIIALSGAGEKGNGTTDLDKVFTSGIGYLLKTKKATMQFSYPNGVHGSFVVLLPQLDPKYLNWAPGYVGRMISWAKANLNIDPDRIFITGYSLGGGGTWIYPASGKDSAMRIAGIVPVSASGLPAANAFDSCNIGKGGTAVWAIHTSDDNQIPTTTTSKIVNGVNACLPAPITPIQTWYPIGNHQIYDLKIFPDTANQYAYPNIYQWMLGVNRKNVGTANQAPIANVGATDTTVVVTTSYHYRKTITGVLSTDPNDVIIKYLWSWVSGDKTKIYPFNSPVYYLPVDFNNTSWPRNDLDYRNMTWPDQNFEFTALGTYVFNLTVTDMFGATSSVNKTVRLTNNSVNTAPYVSLGNNVTLTATASDTSVNISATVFDWETANLSAFSLTPDGANPTTVKNDVPGWYQTKLHPFITPGVYKFTLTATDGQGLSNSSTITITKQAPLPVTYLYFNGANNDGKNILKWATSKELNNDHFDVLKSDDGVNFSTVVTIPPSTAATETKEYTFTDISPFPGNNYYRLAQYDIDGTKKLSEIINIRNAGNTVIATYPNPIKDQLYFTLKSSEIKGVVKARVLDASGKVVKQMNFEKSTSVSNQSIQLPGLQSGIYILELSQDNGWQSVHRFVK